MNDKIIPRKVSVLSEKEPAEVISELMAFWRHMQREHRQPHAEAILKFLKKTEPAFRCYNEAGSEARVQEMQRISMEILLKLKG